MGIEKPLERNLPLQRLVREECRPLNLSFYGRHFFMVEYYIFWR